jgi:hypothetical protein
MMKNDELLADFGFIAASLAEEALNALNQPKRAAISELLATGQRDLVVAAKLSTGPLVVVGYLTSPTGAAPAEMLFQVHGEPLVGHTETYH